MRAKPTTTATFGLRLFVILALVFTAVGISTTPPAAAQGYSGVVIGALSCDSPSSCWNEIGAQFSVTTEDGEYLGSCTVTGERDASNAVEGCLVEFPFVATGTLIVTEDPGTITPGYAPEENPIYVDTSASPSTRPSHDAVFHNVPVGGVAQTSDIAIVPTENGQSITDACFILTTYGDPGCDDNGDGKITFRGVPLGTYTVHQTADLGPGRSVPDFTIQVTGNIESDGWERFGASVISTGSSTGSIDIALITRDPDDGHLLTGACYQLIGYGNEGCDENGDGQVTFAAVPYGTYAVQQTQTPSGYPTITNYEIDVQPFSGLSTNYDIPVGFVVKQAVEQNTAGTRNVSVIFVDSRTYTKVPSSICMEFVGASDVGCDDDLVDGQIDFLDVPTGTYPVDFSNLPDMWQLLVDDVVGPSLTVEADSDTKSNQIIYIWAYVPDSATTTSSSSASSVSSQPVATRISERTWTAAVWVRLCDAQPGSGVEVHCQGGVGIVVNFSLATGEFLGSCTTGDPYSTPWGPDTVSDCSVEGMPFNADIVASQDPSTIPAGYAPSSETSVVHIGDGPLPFQDGPPFSLLNVRTDSSSNSTGTSSSNPNATATLLLTFRGCPEGFDPNIDDPYANCTIPLDAPDASQIIWGGDGQGGMNITGLDRQYDGAYIYNAGPHTMNVHIGRLAPVVRDDYQVIGADSVDGDIYIINLADGETREVFIFYYFYP